MYTLRLARKKQKNNSKNKKIRMCKDVYYGHVISLDPNLGDADALVPIEIPKN